MFDFKINNHLERKMKTHFDSIGLRVDDRMREFLDREALGRRFPTEESLRGSLGGRFW